LTSLPILGIQWIVKIIKTTIFNKAIKKLLNDQEVQLIEDYIVDNPFAGDEIKGSKGLRKVRFPYRGKGKSGGIRVIYYVMISNDSCYLITAYPKSKKIDLTSSEIKLIGRYIEEQITR